ncbi:hypothetical protein [Laribacter hongkongensis]|uniref:hypothetical protein n=1 Tax=Laribacter hongkongensis TaxID=168471 RepID=UPI001EFE1E67|nr:hypothetical protein [Laribacter hongkongensis]
MSADRRMVPAGRTRDNAFHGVLPMLDLLSWDEWIFVLILAIVPLAGAVFHLWVMLHGHGKPRSDRDSA